MVASLKVSRNGHVLVEVPTANSMAQAESLLAAARKSSAVYMLAENYCYTRPNIVVDAMVHKGMFGHIYYGESEYLHEMRSYYTTATGEQTWRYYWHAGRDGHPYPTHNLGPLLDWFDDHISAVSCVGSGRHTDPRYTLQDTTLLLCRTSRGALLNVRLDFLSKRPQLLGYYALQGTEGVYESARSVRDEPRVYIQGRTAHNEWDPLEKCFDEFLSDRYKRSLRESGIGEAI